MSVTAVKNPSSWDTQDDILLRHLKEVKNLGWKDISLYFNNRTPNACQFRWRRLKSGNLKSNKTALIDVSNITVPKTYYEQNLKMNMEQEAKIFSKKTNQEDNTPFEYQQQTVPTPQGGPAVQDIKPFPQPSIPIKSNSPSTTTINVSEENSSFSKPRSFSHTLGNPFSSTNPSNYALNSPNSLSKYHQPLSRFNSGDENIGFIPKVVVKSRRGSAVIPGPFEHSPFQFQPQQPQQPPQQPHQQSTVTFNETSPGHSPNGSYNGTNYFTSALNTTLNGSKARKNSFVNWSRRNSFNFASTSASRRSSLIQAPTSMNTVLPGSNNSSHPTSRRQSVERSSINNTTSTYVNPLSAPSQSYIDSPLINTNSTGQRRASRTSIALPSSQRRTSIAFAPTQKNYTHSKISEWTRDEELLLIDCHAKNMTQSEMSIVLPNKSDAEIKIRLNLISQFQLNNENQQNSSAVLEQPTPCFAHQMSESNADVSKSFEVSVDPLNKNESVVTPPSSASSKEVSPAPLFSPSLNDSSASISASSSSMSMNEKPGECMFGAIISDQKLPSPILQNENVLGSQGRKLPTISALLNDSI
ncbi:Transcriptional regulatory protein DOT6 [Nakaseomyces bracarensis]|uniref:Transcriptional regulatory protein DOT6 n=1 Tax=Nakaseomyces bracarensis TaxID=273131 RepID=A0ABR4NVY7_9SACH